MTDEDIIDCILEVDKTLSEVESAFELKDYKKAAEKLREARDAINELRQDDSTADESEVEMNIMNKLK